VEEFSGEGVKHDVNASIVRHRHYVAQERRIARIEDTMTRDIVVVHEVADLVFIAHRAVYLFMKLLDPHRRIHCGGSLPRHQAFARSEWQQVPRRHRLNE